MELRHFRYFVAVAEEQSFTRAAERLWISQPGLSVQIRALERELGTTLLIRHNRGVVLTEAGECFLDKARTALNAFDSALAEGRDAAAGRAGRLRLGIGSMARSELGPTLLEAYRALRPGVEVSVVEAHSDALLRDVRDGRLDAAVALGPVAQPELDSTVLREERVLVAIADHHPLARLARVAPDELDGETVVVSGDRDGAGYDRCVRQLLERFGVRVSSRQAGYGAALLSPVRAGAAVALLSRSGADLGSGVVTRPLDARVSFRFDLVWPRGTASPLLATFLECSRQAAAATRLWRDPTRRPLAATIRTAALAERAA
jgi:DNA-binding transcriptional LysR family regulator